MAHWLSDQDILAQIEACVRNPIMGTVMGMRPYGIDERIFTGELKSGDHLMQPTGVPEHEQTINLVGADDETIRCQWKYQVRGFWAASCTATLYLPFGIRGLVPVWQLNLYGKFADAVFGDLRQAELIEDALARSQKHPDRRLRSPSEFYPRGIPGVRSEHLVYGSAWTGHPLWFSGIEHVQDERSSRMLWEATFHGGVLMPIS